MVHASRCLLAALAAFAGLTAVAGCATANAAQPATAVAGSGAVSVAGAPARPGAPGPPGSSVPTSGPPPAGVNVTAFNALAGKEASAWARSPLAKVWRTGLVVLLAGDLSSGPRGGFPSGETKEAFGNGNLVLAGPPPSGAPAGVVTWPGGSSMKVPVLSEAQAFSAMKNNTVGRCPGCATTPLAVTAAKPATLQVPTSRGTATVPAWAFTLRGVSSPVIQAALPPGSYVTPNSYPAPAGKLGPLGRAFVGVAQATGSADGRTLTLLLPGDSCDTSWGGLVAEVGGVVVAGGWMRSPHRNGFCAGAGIARATTVRLAAPLGGRLILDAATGQPVTPGPLSPGRAPG